VCVYEKRAGPKKTSKEFEMRERRGKKEVLS